MKLATEKLKQLDNPTLTFDERAEIRCQVAADLIHAGRYEAAIVALGDLWRGVGQRPPTEGFKVFTAGEVLLQVGVLAGWIGSARNLGGSQEAAKDLISEALRLFQSINYLVKVAEAQYEFAMPYWRLGAFDEARVVLINALSIVGDKNDELKAKIHIRRALIETWACRHHDALAVLKEAEPFFMNLTDAFKGRWHGQMGSVLRHLAVAGGRADYLDRAIIEYTAAIFHYEKARHERYCAVNLNNLAMLLYRVGRYQEAHENLDRAVAIFSGLKDAGNLAQVNETRARVLVAERCYAKAERIIDSSVQVFERGGEQSCLADALTIQATVLARLGQHERSVAIFRRAMRVAAEAGALEKAGQAALSLIEEHGNQHLSKTELYELLSRADEFLKNTQDLEDIKRLRACAHIVARKLLGVRLSDPDFSLNDVIHAYEAEFIEEALEKSKGSVTHAAKLLGLKHHASLAILLRTRHKQLLDRRTPAVPRKRSFIPHKRRPSKKPSRPITILHVESDTVTAEATKEMLERLGWRIVTHANATTALEKIRSKIHYDFLLFDSELPDMNGIDLLCRTRQFSHRQRTPIIITSAHDCEREAWGAGAAAFLRKPQAMASLAATIKRLLTARPK